MTECLSPLLTGMPNGGERKKKKKLTEINKNFELLKNHSDPYWK